MLDATNWNIGIPVENFCAKDSLFLMK